VFQHPPSTIPKVTVEILCLRMNEIVAGQLHVNTINIQDTQAARIVELERQVNGMGLVLHGLCTRVEGLVEKLDEAHTLSVMCQALLTHYVESHWVPIAGLMEQIGSYAACQLVTGSPPHGPCDLSDAGAVSKGADEPSSPSSLPLLESVSSSIDSIYFTPGFLQSAQGTTSFTPPEVIPFVVQRRSTTPPTLSPSFPGDTGSFGLFDQGVVDKTGLTGFPLLGDEGWSSGGSGGNAVDSIGVGY